VSRTAPDPPTADTIGHGAWTIVDEGELADRLRAELKAEIGPGHILYGGDPTPLTLCTTCSAVGLHLGRGRFAIVELTGSATEEAPPRPTCQRFDTFDALRETLNRHRHR
jgi:hypothetical protein